MIIQKLVCSLAEGKTKRRRDPKRSTPISKKNLKKKQMHMQARMRKIVP